MGALGILRVHSFPFFSQEDGTQPWKALGKAPPAVYVASVTGVRLTGRGQNIHTSPKDLDEASELQTQEAQMFDASGLRVPGHHLHSNMRLCSRFYFPSD